MRRIAELLLVCGMLQQVAAGGGSDGDTTRSVLVRISDWETYLKPTAGPNSVGNCLIVYGDGRLHLELRRQEFLRGNGNYSTYESIIPERGLTLLHSILESPEIRRLSDLDRPKLPLRSAHVGWFTADIYRDGAVQRVGYLFWDGEPKPSRDEQTAWQAQRAALQPLVEWSRTIKSMNGGSSAVWRKVRNADPVCQPQK